jgi:hypothetical protein
MMTTEGSGLQITMLASFFARTDFRATGAAQHVPTVEYIYGIIILYVEKSVVVLLIRY